LGLALDELRDNDESFEDRGITYLVEKDFFEEIKPVTIDYVTTPMGEGFSISSSLQKPEGACSSCGSSC
jgi:Fe-S cluster assembly iron-binding protein IscA